MSIENFSFLLWTGNELVTDRQRRNFTLGCPAARFLCFLQPVAWIQLSISEDSAEVTEVRPLGSSQFRHLEVTHLAVGNRSLRAWIKFRERRKRR